MSKALEAAHEHAVLMAGYISGLENGGLRVRFDVYRDALLSHLAEDEAVVEKLSDVIADAMNMNRTGRLEHDAALAVLRALSGKE